MEKIRFILLGGFLGAGKTTTIARLARAYAAEGKRVGIVTNDQADDLVDTLNLRSQGFNVAEVAGACFCCSFNDLTQAVEQLEAGERPDVILAEPVGSCADLAATVIQPLQRLYDEKFDVAPYGVIIKPSHGRKILSGQSQAGFSPNAEYIFRKQLEEADFVILNRIDQLTPVEVAECTKLLEDAYPEMPVVQLSAVTGEGLEKLLEAVGRRGRFGRRILDIDYDVYAEGEAELGWLNSRYELEADSPFVLNDLLVDLVQRLSDSLAERSAETAHVKAIGAANGCHAVANLVTGDSPVELSQGCDCRTESAEITVNARVAIAPEELVELVGESVGGASRHVGAAPRALETRSLRPGRPVPTHRFAEPVSD